jgi:hypothetical protein
VAESLRDRFGINKQLDTGVPRTIFEKDWNRHIQCHRESLQRLMRIIDLFDSVQGHSKLMNNVEGMLGRKDDALKR